MSQTFETLTVQVQEPFLTVTLDRPEVRNAMNQQMIAELRRVFTNLHKTREIRAVVIRGTDGMFCAGGDLKEMQAAYAHKDAESGQQTRDFDGLLRTVNSAPQVVITQVEGVAMGGGFGLVCVSDIAIAAEDTIFGLPEVRLGIVPALISPYVIQRVGLTTARRLMLTGARFDGIEAAKYGLIHEVCPPDEVEERVQIALADIRECAPGAIAACKRLLFEIVDSDFNATAQYRADLLDELRRKPEGQEGMLAFIRKSKPKWARTEEKPGNGNDQAEANLDPHDTRF